MDFMPLVPFLGESVLECLVLYYMALILAGKKVSPLFIVALSLLTSLFSYAIRSLPLLFGIHTFLQLTFMVIFLNLFFRIPWRVAIIVMVLTGVILGLTEGISVPLFAWFFSYKLEEIISDPLLRIVFALPHLFLLAGLTYIATKRGWRLPLLKRMMVAGKRPEMRFIVQNYLFILCLVQALVLALLNISYFIYSAAVFPSFTLETLALTSSIMLTVSAIVTIVIAGYLFKYAEREARLETELRYIKEMNNLNLKTRVERHDFYNHLTAIYGYLKANQYKQAESYIKTLYENVRQIEDLLGVNPPELGALLSVKQEEAKARGIEFHWQVNIDGGVMPLSPEDLTQLTGNLLDNALEASESGHPGRVDLAITNNKLGLQLKLSNTGIPIPQDFQNNIFAPGYTTKDSSHSGLGLFIIKKIVDRHGGQLELTKPENYQGVEFVIYIPWKG